MSTSKFNGVFSYKDKEYPFSLDGHVLCIPQPPFQYNADFEEFIDYSSLHGTVSNGYNIVFIGCALVKYFSVLFNPELKMTIQGYVLLGDSYTTYDRIDFYSPAINCFYSPSNAYSPQVQNNAYRGLSINDNSEYRKAYLCTIDNEEISVGFDIFVQFNLKEADENIGKANSMISLEFLNQKFPTDIVKYYFYVLDFLHFVSFRSDIPIDTIKLFARNEQDKYEQIGQAVLFQNDVTSYTPDSRNSITFSPSLSVSFSDLFSEIASRRLNCTFNPFLYPKTRLTDELIDAPSWLITAIGFEGEFDITFPHHKATTSPSFNSVKSLLLQTIDDEVKKSGKSINNKVNSDFQRFRHLVLHTDTSIEEKFRFCQSCFEEETRDVINELCKLYNIPKGSNLSRAYATFRNQTAHGTIRKPATIDVVTLQVLRCFIYTMFLTKSHVPTDEIKNILHKLFSK